MTVETKPEHYNIIMVLGVAGVGKSSIAEAVCPAIGGVYLDADDYHPARNIRSMEAGIPLDDDMRWPWLAAVCEASSRLRMKTPVVIACSGLKKRYRDLVRERLGEIMIVNPVGPAALILERMEARTDHYMPPELLKSQIHDFENPSADERAFEVSIAQSLPDIAALVVEEYERRAAT